MTSLLARVVSVLATVALGATACSGPGPGTPSPGSQVSSDATEQVDPDPESGDVRWRTPAYPDRVLDVAEIGDGYVVMTTGATIGLDADGQREWVVREPAKRLRSAQAEAVGGVVVRRSEPDEANGLAHIRVLDARSGRVLWQADVGTVELAPRLIFIGTCAGETGGCTVVAREAAAGRVRWRTPVSAGLSDLEHVGDALHATSHLDGTDRTADPYGERTTHQVLDARTGAPRGPDLLGSSFRVAGPTLIEESYRGSVDTACTVTLVARLFDGRDLWTRSFDWTLSRYEREKDWDCALAPDVDALGGGRVDVTARNGFGQVLDVKTGRTLWDHGHRRTVLASHDGADAVTDYAFRTIVGFDARTHRERWRVTGNLSDDDPPPVGFLGFGERSDGGEDQVVLRSIRTGKVSLRVTGEIAGYGDDWAAVAVQHPSGGYRVALIHWPH